MRRYDPLTEVAKAVLMRQTPLTEDDWVRLIEARREMMLPHLKEYDLSELGEYPLLHNGRRSSEDELRHHSPAVYPAAMSLSMRGIFDEQPAKKHQKTPTHGTDVIERLLWGLNEDGVWVSVVVFMKTGRDTTSQPFERPFAVNFAVSSALDIMRRLEIDPRVIMTLLFERIRQHHDNLAERAHQAEDDVRQAIIENALLGMYIG